MSEIPEDVMKAARKGVKEWLNEQEGYGLRGERAPLGINDWLEIAYALGIMAERQRCLKIAEQRTPLWEEAVAIAAAIGSLPNRPPDAASPLLPIPSP